MRMIEFQMLDAVNLERVRFSGWRCMVYGNCQGRKEAPAQLGPKELQGAGV